MNAATPCVCLQYSLLFPQAVRSPLDLNCMAVPAKFRELGDFHLYYSGVEKAPYVTVFVGGNHEASNHLFELYYGGWVAPNIYYMGAANVLRLGSLRIAGLSGIWKGYNYRKPHYERLPYNGDDVRSIYHVREFDTRKLLQLSTQIDVGISHDWPSGVEWMGDYKWLFRKKDSFEADARSGKLGSVAAKLVLQRLRPPYWFSAHLHIKYAAVVDHNKPWPENAPLDKSLQINGQAAQNGTTKHSTGLDGSTDALPETPVQNADEIDLDIDDVTPTSALNTEAKSQPTANTAEIDLDLDDDADDLPTTLAEPPTNIIPEDIRAQLPAAFAKAPPRPQEPDPPTTITNTTTHFLALDKCLPRRDFLQLLEIPTYDTSNNSNTLETNTFQLSYDPEWLAITRVFASSVPILPSSSAPVDRDLGRAHYAPLIATELDWVNTNIVAQDKLVIPHNFVHTAPPHTAATSGPLPHPHEMPREYNNPQTQAYCALLQIPNPVAASEEEIMARIEKGPRPNEERQNGGGGRGGGRGGFGGGRGGRGGGGGRGRGGFGRGGGGGRGRGRGRGSW